MKLVDRNTFNTSKLVNVHAGHRQRLRKNLVDNRWENFNDHQFMEYVLSIAIPRKDTNPIAHDLIDTFGSLANVLDASVEDLKTVKGVGEVVATFLHSIPSIFKAYKMSKVVDRPIFSSPAKVFEEYGKTFNHMPSEEFHILCLDSQSRLIVKKTLALGSNNEVSFSLKSITELLVRTNACGVILLHNHPNGDTKPSEEDVKMTKQIFLNLMFNNILVLDHIIVGKYENEYYSFKNSGLLDEFDKEAKSLLNARSILASNFPNYEKDSNI